jgi:hypothetical protein
MIRPAARKQAVDYLEKAFEASERRCCCVLRLNRNIYRSIHGEMNRSFSAGGSIMKTTFGILLVILLLIGSTAYASSAIVTFADPSLEAMICETIGKPEGDITMAEAESIERLNLGIEWQGYNAEVTPIRDIGGLEYFTNLESLDLSYHAITDISSLAGLTKLTFLSLCGNPIADITPLAGLTNLQGLILSDCVAADYSPLAKLRQLDFLMLNNSTIMDVSPLTSLENLKYLFLENSRVINYLPLLDISENLVEKDYFIAATLAELGFIMNDQNSQASYSGKELSVSINHSEWGAPPMERDANCILLSLPLEGGYTLNIGFYAGIDAYVFDMNRNGELLLNYVYDMANDNFMFGKGDRDSSEQALRTVLGDVDTGDVLYAPITIFDDKITNTFNMTAYSLYALPYEPATLKSLGFTPDEANAVYLFTQHAETFTSIEIHCPEWGEKEYDVRFFTPINFYGKTVQGLIVMYDVEEKCFHVNGYLDETSYAKFDYYAVDGSAVDDIVVGADSVKDYFINMYDDPAITDIYTYSVQLVEQFINDTFGMSIDELYALPTGE